MKMNMMMTFCTHNYNSKRALILHLNKDKMFLSINSKWAISITHKSQDSLLIQEEPEKILKIISKIIAFKLILKIDPQPKSKRQSF